MPKNIIVCADGTGNKGGSTPDSNVYKVYKSVNKYFKGSAQDGFEVDEQIIFYDNGVGTKKDKYLRMLGGAFGFGFEDNVCDLYKFLARNYEPGDRVYFFGFSRGASTVRACSGFISICGLAKGKGLRNRELDKLVKEAFDAYKVHVKKPEDAEELKKSERSHGVIDIHFMGVWDTVVALGFPKRTDITGPVSAILNALSWLANKGLDQIWPHSFYNYRLADNVKYAYQALAIDDERTAFWPFVWREKGREADKVEQVWFAGMHSNVGGGYARSGMASIPLHWMLLRAKKRGLTFDDDAIQKALEDSHIHGRMYNSRDGFAIFYRYHPRDIEKLCDNRLEGDIRLHRSVIERINHRTADYAPGQLPGKFTVVESDTEASPEPRNPGKDPKWAKIQAEIDQWVLRRKGLYAAMLTFTLAIVFTAFRLWICPPQPVIREGFWGDLADILDYILPDFFDGLINVAAAQHYYLFIGAAIVVYVYVRIRRWCRIKTTDACERLRHLIIHEAVEDNG
ncbi:FIG00853498: hypothetical protein [hydrothermal vent metagenome]|uniref:T6SS Phospholipase effector Tle1-like catalytic domain-containing protein n=1 Tax=hydrothermal vent metagenome TaxID=652676 RepID=A0A3B1AZE7_9ZZZZ